MNSLFCTIPISALFNIKPAMDVNFGASEVVGALKEKNVNVIHLDLKLDNFISNINEI